MHTAMALGVSGMVFHGADLPGFSGEPNDDQFIQEYQVGTFYPFFRAHAIIDNVENREPWKRTLRV